jgi:hypothetical protein
MTETDAAAAAEPEGRRLDIIERLTSKLDLALGELGKAKPFAKSTYQTDVFQIAETLMQSDEGMQALYERAHTFDDIGVFDGGPWADPKRLQAPLVAGSLKAGGVYPVVESLSELRMLAIAKGRRISPDNENAHLEQHDAVDFLNEAMALNLEFVFPTDTEEDRIMAGPHRESSIRLFALLAEELGLDALHEEVVAEIEQISAQRPIVTSRLRSMIQRAATIPPEASNAEVEAKLQPYAEAVSGSSRLSQRHEALTDYRQILRDCTAEELEVEARSFADAMQKTGLTCPHHAVLLRHLRAKAPELLQLALGLGELGTAELAANRELAFRLIKVGILPATAQAIYGLARVLEFGLLSRQEVAAGLTRLIDLDLQSEVRRKLLAQRRTRDGVRANSILLAGAISVFGQPLGVGQGLNPTCQAARAISLWAQHAHGYLLEMLISAARDGFVQMSFEGEELRSDKLVGGLATRLDLDLDPVSIVLTPHLDVLYDAMMKRVVLRAEDGHKWVNPALYGRWVPSGFASIFADRPQTTVADYDEFVRRFYATHHPAYNEGHPLMYPNPVGILVTNGHGDYLGPHAISLQRVEEDPHGVLRVYFYNPNNEGRQDWGGGIEPTVRENGEREGESSLPFHHFVARLYAFHYNPYEEGDAYAVPPDEVREIEAAARSSWGRAFRWAN